MRSENVAPPLLIHFQGWRFVCCLIAISSKEPNGPIIKDCSASMLLDREPGLFAEPNDPFSFRRAEQIIGWINQKPYRTTHCIEPIYFAKYALRIVMLDYFWEYDILKVFYFMFLFSPFSQDVYQWSLNFEETSSVVFRIQYWTRTTYVVLHIHIWWLSKIEKV